MITGIQLTNLGFAPLVFKGTIAYSINNRCQGVLSNGVFYFRLEPEGEYLQAKNVNHLKHQFRRKHGLKIEDHLIIEALATTTKDDNS